MPRSESFALQVGYLVRRLAPVSGEPYAHRCSPEVYRDVALEVQRAGARGTTLGETVESLDAPWSQAAVALAFMKERGCVAVQRRRVVACSTFVYEDAMCELRALEQAGAAVS